LQKNTKSKPKSNETPNLNQHSSLRMLMCVSLWTTVIHNIAQNSSDNHPCYPLDNHHCSIAQTLSTGWEGKSSVKAQKLKCTTTKTFTCCLLLITLHMNSVSH